MNTTTNRMAWIIVAVYAIGLASTHYIAARNFWLIHSLVSQSYQSQSADIQGAIGTANANRESLARIDRALQELECIGGKR